MGKRILIFTVLVCVVGLSIQAQTEKEIRQLAVGDKLPDIAAGNIINYPKESIKLSSFKGKLLILDFWRTYCGACISSFPKMESLQKEFSGQLQILLVTSQSKSKIQEFFNIRKRAALLTTELPSIVDDTLLQQLFQYKSVPHYVWIDKTGKVISITLGEEVTAKNIKDILSNKKIIMPQKTDFEVPYEFSKPLFVNSNGGFGEELLCHSVLTKHIDGLLYIISGISQNNTEGYSVRSFNQSIRRLYQIAFEEGDGRIEVGIHNNRTILNVEDTSKYVGYVNGKKNYSDLYCYELVAPKSTYGELKQMMKDDLRRYFGLDARLEKRRMKCLILTIKDTSLISSNGRENYPDGGEMNQFKLQLRNMPFLRMLKHITSNWLTEFPLLDETGIKGNVDVDIEADLKDWQAFARALKKYEMELRLEEREVDMLIISEPEGYKFPFDK